MSKRTMRLLDIIVSVCGAAFAALCLMCVCAKKKMLGFINEKAENCGEAVGEELSQGNAATEEVSGENCGFIDPHDMGLDENGSKAMSVYLALKQAKDVFKFVFLGVMIVFSAIKLIYALKNK